MRLPRGVTRRGRAIGVSLLRRLARHHRSVGRFGKNDLHLRALLGEHTPDAFQSAAGSEASHPIVQPLAGEIVDDLARRRTRVVIGIRFVLELSGQKPAVLLGQGVRLSHHSRSAFWRRGQDDFCTEESHQSPALDAE